MLSKSLSFFLEKPLKTPDIAVKDFPEILSSHSSFSQLRLFDKK